MYRTILVPLELEEGEERILEHVAALARRLESEVVLLHVAPGWRSRYFQGRIQHPDEGDLRARLEERAGRLGEEGVTVRTEVVYGGPGEEIVKAAARIDADLIAMATHGHRGILDLILGSPASDVRHEVGIPVLLLRS